MPLVQVFPSPVLLLTQNAPGHPQGHPQHKLVACDEANGHSQHESIVRGEANGHRFTKLWFVVSSRCNFFLTQFERGGLNLNILFWNHFCHYENGLHAISFPRASDDCLARGLNSFLFLLSFASSTHLIEECSINLPLAVC